MSNNELLNAGEISGVFGVKGWVKIFSFTQPRENILRYSPWLLRKQGQTKILKVVQGQLHGAAVIAQLEDVDDRDEAQRWIGAEILIGRDQLPKSKPGEYYWADLIGLSVKTTHGVSLGRIDHLLETGANDVLVIVDGETERLIPFLMKHTVMEIDLDQRSMIVDWDPDF